MRKSIKFVFTLIILTQVCHAQQYLEPSVWSNIELSLRTKKNLEVTRSRLQQLRSEAQRNDDQAGLARAYCYLMLLQDLKTEDTLYFRNSAFIDSILRSGADTTLKGLMHYLLAQRLWKFNVRQKMFNRALYETKDLLWPPALPPPIRSA